MSSLLAERKGWYKMARQHLRQSLLLVSTLSLLLILGACGRTPPGNTTDPTNPTDPTAPTDPSDATDPTTPNTLQPLEISGTGVGWPGGEAVIRAEANAANFSSANVSIAEGAIHSDGSFNLTLPVDEATFGEALVTADTNLFCPEPGVSTIEITPLAPKIATASQYFGVYAAAGSDERLGNVSVNTETSEGFTYVFAAVDATIEGGCVTVDENGYSFTLELDLDLKAGWNAAYATAEAESTVTSVSTGTLEDVSWVYTDELEPVDPTEPIEPTEPSDPTDPTDPTMPIDPTTPDPTTGG